MDKNKLDQILVIPDLENETVLSVVGRMEMLLDIFRADKNYDHLVPFLHVYQLVTKKVQEKNVSEKSYYNNFPAIQRLDVHFADLYFKPLRQYILGQEVNQPWQTYFEYCEGDGIPFVQLLLGINAHINADLNSCILDLDYSQKKDYDRVNQILEELVPEVMEYLAFYEYDIYGLGGVFMRKLVKEEFAKIIVKWRQKAWENAQLINNMSDKSSKENARKALARNTETLATDIIEIFSGVKNFVNPDQFLANLHRLHVSAV